MEASCSRLHELQADVPDSSSVNFAMADPRELLAQVQLHQAVLEEQQHALASLEHRVERVLISPAPQEPLGPGPMGETLAKIREGVRRWAFFHTCVRLTLFEMLKGSCSPQPEREKPAHAS